MKAVTTGMPHPAAAKPPYYGGKAGLPVLGLALMAILLMGCDTQDRDAPGAGPTSSELTRPVEIIDDLDIVDPDQNNDTEAEIVAAANRLPGHANISAIGLIHATEGYSASGEVRFDQEANGVYISGVISGLEPGQHGFHIHEHGDCSAADASSAGGHFAPNGNAHGSPDDMNHPHDGDLGNIVADENGRAEFNVFDPDMTLADGPQSILGKSVIVHSRRDDLVTQPSGDAGKPAGCGLIEKV